MMPPSPDAPPPQNIAVAVTEDAPKPLLKKRKRDAPQDVEAETKAETKAKTKAKTKPKVKRPKDGGKPPVKRATKETEAEPKTKTRAKRTKIASEPA